MAPKVHIEDILLYAIDQQGDRYVFGAETTPQDHNPGAFDCSELVQWACGRAGVKAPDGAANQEAWVQKAGLLIPVEKALTTRGALMFPFPDVHHVVFSLGDGTTIEAKGAKWGVGIFSAKGRFQRAGLIPGVDYTTPHPPLAPVKPAVHVPVHAWPGHAVQEGGQDHHSITLVQRALKIKVDGVYGPKTTAAVKRFQKAHHLPPTGIVDHATWSALYP